MLPEIHVERMIERSRERGRRRERETEEEGERKREKGRCKHLVRLQAGNNISEMTENLQLFRSILEICRTCILKLTEHICILEII